MPAYIETCSVRKQTRSESKGFFGNRKLIYARYVAEISSPSGTMIIAKSDEFVEHDSSDRRPFDENMENWERLHQESLQRMIAQLLSEGWEVMTANQHGEVTSLKRQMGGNSTNHFPFPSSDEPADLLRQLANLKDAGILTEQEFQAKKAEILKRI